MERQWQRILLGLMAWLSTFGLLALTTVSSTRAATWVIGDTLSETYTIAAGNTLTYTDTIAIINDGQLIVHGTLDLTGTLWLEDTGLALFDGGVLHLRGDYTNIYVQGDAQLTFQNNALLHYVTTYVNQHMLYGLEQAQIELTDSRISCDGSSETINLFNSASYRGTNVQAPDWKTWYMYNTSLLRLENFSLGGDVVFYDSPNLTFINSVGLMPWMFFGSSAVIDTSFPSVSPSTPVTMYISNTTPGYAGIPWTIAYTNCYAVAWGINPYPGSQVAIRNSNLTMLLYRFVGPGSSTFNGIMRNNTYYADTTVPVTDRTLRLINTNVKWWKVDIIDGYDLTASNMVFSEMMVKNNSRGWISNSICEGQTINLGAINDAFIQFEDGEVWTYISIWNNATMILRDSLVDYRKGEYQYQTRNIAHNNARLYSLNTTYGYVTLPAESEPEALDNALVTYLKLDTPSLLIPGQSLNVTGSVWIKAGPLSPVTFNHYELAVAPDGNTTTRTVLTTSTVQVKSDSLGTWDTAGWEEGSYWLRLTAWVNNNTITSYATQQYPATKVIQLQNATPQPTSTFTPAVIDWSGISVRAYPIPGQERINVAVKINQPSKVKIDIYNINAERVQTLLGNLTPDDNVLVWECSKVGPGIYIILVAVEGKQTAKFKVAVIK